MIDVTDLNATDAKIKRLRIRRLEDDLSYSPSYESAFLFRDELEERAPELVPALRALENTIDADTMTGMNAQVEIEGRSESRIAADFLAETRGISPRVRQPSTFRDIVRFTAEHLRLVAVSLAAAILVGIPLGVIAVQKTALEQPIFGLASRMFLAGVKTAAVINIGLAKLGGFIGAGGYGEPIFTGIRLNDHGVMLQGAVPAAALALLAQAFFNLVDRAVVPRGLRLKPFE